MAKTIQRNILPTINQMSNFNIVIDYIPMIEVGGDIYDISIKSPSNMRIFLADATGHGIVASLVTMLIKNEYDKLNSSDLTPFQMLWELNRTFCARYSGLNMYFTAIVVDIDVAHNRLVYASGGSPPAFLIGDSGIVELPHTCRAIGVLPELKGEDVEREYLESEKLLLYTDGVFEEFKKDGEEFGEERLRAAIRRYGDEPMDVIIRSVLNELQEFIKPSGFSDDITVIGVEKK